MKNIVFNKNTLWKLREEIVLGSLFIKDFTNSFGITAKSCCDFFDGYIEFIYDLMTYDEIPDKIKDEYLCDYDNKDNLYSWYNCFDKNPFTLENE